jgi:hypothetical protein
MRFRLSGAGTAKVVGVWIASNYLWGLTGGAVGFIVSAALKGFLGIANAYLLVAVALLVAAAILAFVRPLVSRWWAVRNQDLDVEIEREDWHNFDYRARIVEVRLKVKNRTSYEKRIMATQLSTPGGHGVEPAAVQEMANIEIHREVHRRRESLRQLQFPLEANETQRGWMVFAFPWTTHPGATPFTLVLIDELNIEYEARRR